jgi:glucose/arabinose dehydrogenase
MKHSPHTGAAGVAAALWFLSLVTPAQAASLITNGGFESGFSSWTRVDQLGSEGTFNLQSGTLSPVNGDPTPAPTEGVNAAMTDAFGSGSHVLYQDFEVGILGAKLSFDLFIGNRAPQFATPNPASLVFDLTSQTGANTLNQQARVDIVSIGADPFSVAAGDVLQNLYQTKVGDSLVSGYNSFEFDLSSLFAGKSGQTLRLRFAETDNILGFQLGVDNVSLVEIPEPSSLPLFGIGLLALWGRRHANLKKGLTSASLQWQHTPSHLEGFNMNLPRLLGRFALAMLVMLGGVFSLARPAQADTSPPALSDPTLQVSTVLSSGLTQPIGIVFIAPNDYFVLEKATGQVKRVINGVIQAQPVLDLTVNSASERGLLSMVLHPNFPTNPSVYIRWTESSTGVDSNVALEVPLLGNRVDRFVWNGSTLTQAENVIKLRSLQTDNIAVTGHEGTNNLNPAGNHNGGVMKFGPDGKLYVYMGDQGRRGWMQNLSNGPFFTAPQVDDTYGGPAPDNNHLSGVILRLNTDGTAPADNPFFAVGASIGGEVGANIQKIYSYGHRNGFGMAFDPATGLLWETENADDAYSEINKVIPGMNGGWVQFAGPISRIADWKVIETTQFTNALQQVRYPPTRAAYKPALAQSRLYMLSGATYIDPDFSWRYESGPSGAAFVTGTALGVEYEGTFWIGSSRSFQQVGANGGSLYRFKLTADRQHLDVSADPRLADRVADNLFRAQKFEGTESETLKIGSFFGTVTDIEQGLDGNLYIVSLTDNAIYKISKPPN